MTRRQQKVYVAALTMIAFGLRLGYAGSAGGWGASRQTQYREYVVTATRLLDHGVMASPWPVDDARVYPSSLLPPAYVGVVAGVYGLFGPESRAAHFVLELLNAIAGALVVPLVFSIGRRLSGVTAAFLASGLVAVNPTLLVFTDFVWDTALFTLAVTVCAWVAVRLSESRLTFGHGVGFGVLLGVVAMVNPALTTAYPLLVLWPLHRCGQLRWRRLAAFAGATVCGWLIAIAPWTVRNYVRFGELMYIRGGFPFQLWLGVCPEAEENPKRVWARQSPMSTRAPELQARLAELGGEQAFVRDRGEHAWEAIRNQPLRFLRLSGERALDYWFGSVITHSTRSESGVPRGAARLAVMLFLSAETLLLPLALLVRGGPGRDVRWLLAVVALFCLVYCATAIMLRFRSPTEPLIATVIAVSAAELIGRRRRRSLDDGPAP
jgi:4-amino-4-deoxy-L-arabinose transferase-like glycosyltransferase